MYGKELPVSIRLYFLLAGFIPATSGTAYVNGYDIRKDIAHVRSSLGLCPQHDVLFDTLTVEEHLIFFAKVCKFIVYLFTKQQNS